MEQEGQPKPRKVGHLYPDEKFVVTSQTQIPLSSRGSSVVWSVKVKAVPSPGGLLPNVSDSQLDAKT